MLLSILILSLIEIFASYRFGVFNTLKKHADIIQFGPLWRDTLEEIAQIVGDGKLKSLRKPVVDAVIALKLKNGRLISLLMVLQHSCKNKPFITEKLVSIALRNEAVQV